MTNRARTSTTTCRSLHPRRRVARNRGQDPCRLGVSTWWPGTRRPADVGRDQQCCAVMCRGTRSASPARPSSAPFPARTTRLRQRIHRGSLPAIEDRWGGWYVTGTRVPARHAGNLPLFIPPASPRRGPRASRSRAARHERLSHPLQHVVLADGADHRLTCSTCSRGQPGRRGSASSEGGRSGDAIVDTCSCG